jgi:glycosyltransferase involved in cell wall biosynthesis
MLLVVDSLDGGGAERHVVGLAVELARRGHQVTVACSVVAGAPGSAHADLVASLACAGVPVVALTGRLAKRRFSPAFARGLRRLVRAGGWDVVHAHIWASTVAAAVATAGTGVPLLLTEHTEAPWRSPAHRLASRWVYARASAILAVSSAIAALLRGGYAVPAGRITTVLPAVVTLAGPQPARAAPPRAGGPGPVVGLVCRLAPEKGGDVLLRAAALLRPGLPDLRVTVVGDGPVRPRLEALARRLGLGDAVAFCGFRPDAARLIAGLDVLAVPSRSDGSPLVVLEALAAGVPVVASAVGGIPDQVRDGREALLVPPGDAVALAAALRAVLTDPARARALRAAGRRRAADLTHDRMVDEVEDAYRRVLAATARHSLGRTGVV